MTTFWSYRLLIVFALMVAGHSAVLILVAEQSYVFSFSVALGIAAVIVLYEWLRTEIKNYNVSEK